jgi:integrase
VPREVKRRAGTGPGGKAVYEGTGRWQGAYRDAAGERHTQVFATRTAARRWEQDGAAAVRSGSHRDPRAGRVLLADWHARWSAARVVEASTARTDRTYGKDVLGKWGTWPLDAITRMECQAWIAQLVADGRGAVAIGKAAQLLVSLLQAAVDEGLIPANPARGIRLPAAAKQPDRLVSQEEEARLLEALPTAQDRRLVELLFDTGLRYGEAAGLQGHRVDMLRRQLQVVEVLTQTGQLKAYPKSRKSRRVVPLEDRALLAIAAQIEMHGQDGLLFRTARGGRPMVETNWRKRAWLPAVNDCWPVVDGKGKPVLDDDGRQVLGPLPGLLPTPHDLRHTALSRLVAEGVDLRTVQEFAGHESITTTMRYLHAMPDADERVRTALRRVAQRRSGADLAQSTPDDQAAMGPTSS